MEFPWLSLTLLMLFCTGLLLAADIGGHATGDSSIANFLQNLGLDTGALAEWLEAVWEQIKAWVEEVVARIREWLEEGRLHELVEAMQDQLAATVETVRYREAVNRLIYIPHTLSLFPLSPHLFPFPLFPHLSLFHFLPLQ